MTVANRLAGRAREPVDNSLRSPRYIQVYAAIRDWIYQGTYKPGQRLPTEGELCELFGVSRITTRKAVDMLVDEELVVRQPGRGTFVVEDLADAPGGRRHGAAAAQGGAARQEHPGGPGGGPGAGGRRRDPQGPAPGRRRPGPARVPRAAAEQGADRLRGDLHPRRPGRALRPQRTERQPHAHAARAQGRRHRLLRPGDHRDAWPTAGSRACSTRRWARRSSTSG